MAAKVSIRDREGRVVEVKSDKFGPDRCREIAEKAYRHML